jgi:lysophospholipase L1-like esterase
LVVTDPKKPEGTRPFETARRALWSKPVLAVIGLLGLAAAVEALPALARFRVLREPVEPAKVEVPAVPPASSAIGEAELDLATRNRPDLAQPEHLGAVSDPKGPIARAEEDTGPAEPVDASPVPIVDASRSLDRFFAALSRTQKKEPGAVSRLLFFGDSVVASDFGTGTLRRLLQGRFGDAGHGFVLVANAWPQYFHNDVYRLADRGFKMSRVVGPRVSDGLYGLGGVSFVGLQGLRSRVGTAKSGTFGRAVSKFEVAYLTTPGGGVLQVSVDGAPRDPIDTDGPEKRSGFTTIPVPDGEHELELKTTRAPVRLFGVVLERDTPGVVLDAIGLVGARLRAIDESDDAHLAEALRWRAPNLVVYQFGANESADGYAYPMPEYHRTMRAVIVQVERAVPNAGCLVIGAMDRARKEGDKLVTVPILPTMVAEQRAVAAEAGCAFYSAFDAMGGKGSMAKWVRKGFGAGDYTHPTSWGAEQLGKWIYAALMARYAEYQAPKPP